MTRSRMVLLCASLVGACLLVGCARDHREFARTLPYLDIRDDAGIISRSIRGALEAESQRARRMEVHLAILTVPDTGALEPIVFANRAFESYPTYHTAFQEPLGKPDRKRFKKTSPAWAPGVPWSAESASAVKRSSHSACIGLAHLRWPYGAKPRSRRIRSVTRRAESSTNGSPVPGWVLAPAKYKLRNRPCRLWGRRYPTCRKL